MPIPLILLNVLALAFAYLLWASIPKQYRQLFLISSMVPVLPILLFAYFAHDPSSWGLKAIAMVILRGGFAVCIACGALSCYIATNINNREKK